MSESVAVVGGGLFGVTAAVELARSGFGVTLYEQKDDILMATSGSNHWRLHRGYHYPQSDSTARSALEAEPIFRNRFADAVIEEDDHYYAIAEDSWVSLSEYIDFLESHGLEYEITDSDLVNDEHIEQVLCVDENHVDVSKLRSLCWDELNDIGVSVSLNTRITSFNDLSGHDRYVIATYANLNELLPKGHDLRQRFKFEVCEVPLVTLPNEYTGHNIIVVYGPFMSVDPWGETEQFLMGDYHNMRHHSMVGYKPDIPDKFKEVINSGLATDMNISNFQSFKEHGQKYLPGIADAQHKGSFFTIRTILPDVEDTDARPTLVNQSGDVITIFGGKLATSVHTSREVSEIAENVWT